MKVWFASQNFRPLEIEDKTNLTLVIISCVIYKMKFSIEPRDLIFVKGYGFYVLIKIYAKVLIKISISYNLSCQNF